MFLFIRTPLRLAVPSDPIDQTAKSVPLSSRLFLDVPVCRMREIAQVLARLGNFPQRELVQLASGRDSRRPVTKEALVTEPGAVDRMPAIDLGRTKRMSPYDASSSHLIKRAG